MTRLSVRHVWLHACVFAVALANLAIIATWPWTHDRELGRWLLPVYAGTCHQIPSRCYHVAGRCQPVCARCVGLWSGAALAAGMVMWGFGRSRFWNARCGLGLCGVLLASWLLGWSIIPAHWHMERTVTGIIGAIGLYMVLMKVAASLRASWSFSLR